MAGHPQRLRVLRDLARAPISLARQLQDPLWSKVFGTAFSIAVGLATLLGVYGLHLYRQQRSEEANELLRKLEEELAFRDPARALSLPELQIIKDQIDTAYHKSPRSARAWALGGLYQSVFWHSGKHYRRGAMGACEKSLKLDTANSLGLFCRGVTHLVNGDISAAEADLRTVTVQEPNWAAAWYRYAHVMWWMHREKAAEDALRQARRLDPQKLGYTIELAGFYLRHERHEDTIKVLREAATAFPEAPELHNSLAIAFFAVEQTVLAEAEARRAVTLNSREFQYSANLACLLNYRRDHESALRFATQALGLRPDSPDAILEATIALAATKRYQLALRYSHQLTGLVTGYAWIKDNHYFLETVDNANEAGMFLHGPVTANLRSMPWALTRLGQSDKGLRAIVTKDGKIVFPPDLSGEKMDEPQKLVTFQPGETEKEVSFEYCDGECSETPTVDARWLSLDWLESDPP